MAKNEMCREITAEQAYQEDLLEHSYRNSGNPDFVRRADVMKKSFDENSQRIESVGYKSNQQVTIFEQ